MSSTRTPNGWQYHASSAPGAPGPQWSQFVSYESTTTTSPFDAEHGYEGLLGGLMGSQHPFPPSPLGSHPPFPPAPPSSIHQPQQPLSEANLATHNGSETGGGNVYPQSAAGGSSWRAPTAAQSIASGSRPGRNAAASSHRSSGTSSAASRSIRMGQSAFSDSGSVAPSSRGGSVSSSSRGGSIAPSSRGGSVAPSSHGGGVAPSARGGSVASASRGGSVAPSSHAGSAASHGSRNSNATNANQTFGQGPNWANTTIGFGPGGWASSHLRHSWDL